MKVEVVFARPGTTETASVELPPGATVREALAASGFQVSKDQAMGIFGKRVALEHPLAPGDRVEIYRPLAVDPKEARRRRAKAKR